MEAITEFILEDIEVNKFRTIPFISSLSKITGISSDDMMEILKYNIITPKVLSILARKDISTIQNMMRPRVKDGKLTVQLKTVHPWKVGNDLGPAFVLFDENCFSYIKSTL